MKLFSADQIKKWDDFTLQEESIPSVALMERAAHSFVTHFLKQFPDTTQSVHLYAGPGNNGGDALAIARMLHFEGYPVELSLCEIGSSFSKDFSINLDRLPGMDTIAVRRIKKGDPLPAKSSATIVIDGIFGTGLNRPVEGYWAQLIEAINQLPGLRVAIDIPSGLPADGLAFGTSIRANYTISFERPKLSFFLAENAPFLGRWKVVEIGLSPIFDTEEYSPYYALNAKKLAKNLRQRPVFSHKGSFGHALILAGSYGMLGAAQLCGGACLRSGVGLLSMYVPKVAYQLIQLAIPEAMVKVDTGKNEIQSIPDLSAYSAIGMGPGIGQAPATASALLKLLQKTTKPLVLDADALNILAQHPDRLKILPKNSILTPHPGEFTRLFKSNGNSWEQLQILRQKSQDLQIIIILKGAYTRIALPDGSVFFNQNGNPGMATGGSGDVLTGILTGLLAQGYPPKQAALLGVYLHGSAGDISKEHNGEEALLAGDIVQNLGKAFLNLRKWLE